MAQAFLVQKSGGGINQTLPSQITAFVATADTAPSITLSWTNPTEYFGGVLIVKKIGTAPTSPTDGEKIYSGTAETFTDADVQFDTEYFYRAFAYNAKKQYQTLYAVASAKPVSGIPLSEMAEGTLINIPEDSVDTLFYLAKHDYESALNGAGRQLMVRKNIHTKGLWCSNNTIKNKFASSTINSWCNSTYKALFNSQIQEKIGETIFYYTVGNGDYSVTTLSKAIFILSATELGYSGSEANVEGSALPIADRLKIANLDDESACSQYTRSPCITDKNKCLGTSKTGIFSTPYVYSSSSSAYSGYRPCFTLPSNMLVDPTPNADGSYNLLEVA